MAFIHGELERAQLETLSSDPTLGIFGRLWWNTADEVARIENGTKVIPLSPEGLSSNPSAGTAGRIFWQSTAEVTRIDTGSAIIDLIDAKGNGVFGTSGTASENIRPQRPASGVLALLTGNLTTAEGVDAAAGSLAQLRVKMENFGTPPTAGDRGRIIWDSTAALLKVDNGTSFEAVGSGTGDENLLEPTNLSIEVSLVATNKLSISLKGVDGNAPSGTNIVQIPFRSVTATSSIVTTLNVTSPVGITLTAGSSIGHRSGVDEYGYVYAARSGSAVAILVSGSLIFDDLSVQSTTSEGGAGGATDRSTLYNDNSLGALSNVPIRLLGRFKSNQVTAGLWASAITEASIVTDKKPGYISKVQTYNPLGHGSSGTKIRTYTNNIVTGSDITYTADTVNGDTFTINKEGMYSMQVTDIRAAGGANIGFSVNASDLTLIIDEVAVLERLGMNQTAGAGATGQAFAVARLYPGDIVRAHDDASLDTIAERCGVIITRISD